MVGFRMPGRRTGDQHRRRAGYLVFTQPGRGELAPVVRIFGQFDRLHAVGKRQSPADGPIMADARRSRPPA